MKPLLLRPLLLFIAIFFAAQPSFAGKDEWVEVRSKHFTVITDDGEKNGRAVALRFEQMRAGFASVFQKATVNIPVPVQIIAFRSGKELKQYGPVFNGKPVELAGYFQPGEDRNFIALDLSAPNGWSTVFHEYAHLLLNGNLRALPLWLDEGYADFCSSFEISGKNLSIGTVPRGQGLLLIRNRWLRTSEILNIKHESRDYNEGDRRGVFYAQSWLMVHYIMLKDKTSQANTYINLSERQHLPTAEAFQRAFGMTPDAFDKELYGYSRGPMQYLRVAAPTEDIGSFEVRALPALEKDAILADLKFHVPAHTAEGAEEFKKILALDPNNVLANRQLAYSFLRKGNFEEAAPYLKRASASGSSDPRVHFFNAMLLSRSTSGMLSTDNDDIDEVRAELKKAIELDPKYSEAYNLLAYTDSKKGDLEEARKNQAKAVELSPRNEFYLMNLANYEMRQQKWNEARDILKSLSGSTNPMVVANVQQSLSQLDQMERWRKEHPDGRMSFQGDDVVAVARTEQPEKQVQQLLSQSVGFLKGTILNVDCNHHPEAMLEVKSGAKTWHLRVQNRDKVTLIGADQFSCGWKGKSIAVNYRELGAGAGDIISLEIQ